MLEIQINDCTQQWEVDRYQVVLELEHDIILEIKAELEAQRCADFTYFCRVGRFPDD